MAKPKNRRFSNKQLLLFAVIAVAIAITAFMFFISNAENRIKGVSATADAKISFNSGSTTILTTKTVKLLLDTTKAVSFARVDFSFDPTKLSLIGDISISSNFKNVIKKTPVADANVTGNVSIVVAVPVADKLSAPSGLVELATFTISNKVISTNLDTTSLSIKESSTQIVGTSGNTLSIETSPLALSLNKSATSTPSTATPIPTIKPTVAPTVNPTTAPTAYSVKIQNLPNSTTSADTLEVNYIQIGDRKYQETNTFLAFSSNWITTTTFKYTTRTAWVTFTSDQPTIILGTSKGPTRGSFQVYVNNILKRTYSLTQSTQEAANITIDLR